MDGELSSHRIERSHSNSEDHCELEQDPGNQIFLRAPARVLAGRDDNLRSP